MHGAYNVQMYKSVQLLTALLQPPRLILMSLLVCKQVYILMTPNAATGSKPRSVAKASKAAKLHNKLPVCIYLTALVFKLHIV